VRRIALAVAFALAASASASADYVIQSSPGGRIGDFLELYAGVRESGRRVIIDGPCLSACTLVLSMVPRQRICVTRRAVLGFHAAWRPDETGRPLTHTRATKLMLGTYPPAIRNWIKRQGGLSRRMILLRGRHLTAMYRRCG
jgi:hypothetical protein